MKRLLIIFLCLLTLKNLTAQADYLKLKIYNTWVSMYDSKGLTKAVLHSVNDSAIIVSNSTTYENYLAGNYIITELPIQRTQMIQLRKRDKVSTSMLIGAGVGMGLGLLMGEAIGDVDFSLDLYAPSSGHSVSMVAPMVILFGTLGTVVGAIAGSTKVKIPIGGSMNDYKKEKLKKYSLEDQLY